MSDRLRKYSVLKNFRRRRVVKRILLLIGVVLVLGANISVALLLANDKPGDGKLYEQLAVNLVQQGVFSAEPDPPFPPTLIRLPGYPLMLAAIYEVAGIRNDSAVRAFQAILNTTASALAAAIAYLWIEGSRRRRRKAAWATFFLVGLCPFLLIYNAVILTETAATFVLAGMMLAATLAIKAKTSRMSFAWWVVAGLFAGAGVLLRPDSGLFALGAGLTLVVSILFRKTTELSFPSRFGSTISKGLVFTGAFVVMLAPWTIRNERTFSVFQPLAPEHAQAPGEYVPLGYYHWVRTWIDDQRYIEPVLWNLEDKPIPIDIIPANAFRSEEERARVSALLEAYNNSDPDRKAADDNETSDTDDSSDESDASDESDQADAADADESYDLKISPEVDAEFEKIAQERVAASPFEYYVELPAERATSMWFDTHSAYYPFEGELFPMKELDGETGQNIWLPMFAGLTWVYTLVAFGGAWLIWRDRRQLSFIWLFMAAAVSLPRILFFATLENPEPRYFVELFLVTSILGGIFLSRFRLRKTRNSISFELTLPVRRANS